MTIALDPFQMIRAVAFPRKIVVESAGTIITADALGSNTFWACEDCETRPTFGTYYSQASFTLSAPMLNCNQFDWIITGRSSGVSTYWGWSKEILALWGDCWDFGPFCYDGGNPPPGGIANCDVKVGTSRHYAAEPGNTLNNRWVISPGYWNINQWVFDAAQRGYLAGESIDVTLTASGPTPITLIEDWPVGDIRITAPGHGMLAGAYITVSGTVDYDGDYQVKTADTDRVTVAGTYVTAETSGTMDPKYDG